MTALVEKLLRLVLAPTATDGEILNSARALQRLIGDADPITMLGGSAPARIPDAILPFGKHKGERVSVIAAQDENYLEWLHNTVPLRGSRLREAVEYWRKAA